jgi:hypothetical protein
MSTFEWYGKTKLAKGFSFPATYSTLESMTEAAAFPHLSSLFFTEPCEHHLLRGRFVGARSTLVKPSLSLWINAVPSTLRKRLNELLLAEGFPALSAWAKQFADHSLARAQLDHTFGIRYEQLNVDATRQSDLRLLLEIDQPSPGRKQGRFRANVRHNAGGRR